MLALVARNLRWVRSWANRFTSVADRDGLNFDTNLATMVPGETLTRIHFGYQMIWTAAHLPEWPWNQNIMFGIIDDDARATFPPARPLDQPNADWIWREPVIFNTASRQLDDSNSLLLNVVAGGVAQRSVQAQRRAVPEFGSDIWFNCEWTLGLPAGNAVTVRLNQWFSVGILEP